jgi:hypothetical protein
MLKPKSAVGCIGISEPLAQNGKPARRAAATCLQRTDASRGRAD